jgi:hypothetical protein
MPKISIELSEEELEAIKYLKEKKGSSGREIFRRALGVYTMLEEAKEKGEKIVIEGKRSKKEIVNW